MASQDSCESLDDEEAWLQELLAYGRQKQRLRTFDLHQSYRFLNIILQRLWYELEYSVCLLATAACIEGLVQPPEHIEVVVPIAPPGAVFKTGSAVKYISDNYWKLRVPKHLAELPRMKGVIQDIMAQPALKLDLLPSQTLASKILERAHIVIRGLPDNCCFKIGLTSNPVHRWCNTEYGYQHTSKPCWASMRIVGILAPGEAAGFLEAAPIDRWQLDARCLNSATGGEGLSCQEGPWCVYVVVGTRPDAR